MIFFSGIKLEDLVCLIVFAQIMGYVSLENFGRGTELFFYQVFDLAFDVGPVHCGKNKEKDNNPYQGKEKK